MHISLSGPPKGIHTVACVVADPQKSEICYATLEVHYTGTPQQLAPFAATVDRLTRRCVAELYLSGLEGKYHEQWCNQCAAYVLHYVRGMLVGMPVTLEITEVKVEKAVRTSTLLPAAVRHRFGAPPQPHLH
jgi:hypothetical protein